MSQPSVPAADCRPRGADRILLWPAVVAVAIPIILILLEASIGLDLAYTVVGEPAIIVVWVIAAIVALIIALRARKRQKRRRAFSAAVLPAVVLIALVQPLNFDSLIIYTGDFIHFEQLRPSYVAEIRAMPKGDGPRLIVFDWGGMIWLSCGVVYDESDEIALPPAKQSAAWKRRADDTELFCGYTAQSFGSHFYRACFPC